MTLYALYPLCKSVSFKRYVAISSVHTVIQWEHCVPFSVYPWVMRFGILCIVNDPTAVLSCQANRYLHSIALFLYCKTHCTRYDTVAPKTTTNLYKNTFKSSNAFRIHKWFSMAIANIWYSHRKIYTFVTMAYRINDDIFAICVSFISVLFFYRYPSHMAWRTLWGDVFFYIKFNNCDNCLSYSMMACCLEYQTS